MTPTHRTRTGLTRGLGWLVLPVAIALFIALDPYLSRSVTLELWQGLRLDRSPLRLTPVAALALAFGLLALLLARRISGFASPALIGLVATSQLNGIGLGPIDIFDVALLAILVLWVVRLGLDPGRTVTVPPLLFAVAGLVILGIAHMPLLNPVVWFVGMSGIIRVAVIVFLVCDLCRDRQTLDLVLRIFLVVALASAVVGIVQFALAYLDIFYFTLIKPAITAFKPSPIGFVMRASGLSITAQHFSSFLVHALPVALWRASETRSLLSVFACAIILGGIGVSLNFGGIFAAVFVLALLPALRWPDLIIHYALVLLALVAAAYFTGLLALAYDLTFGDSGVAKAVGQRKTLFSLGIEQVARNPIVGTGLRGFGNVDGNFWDRPVHNLFGQAASELGLLAALLMGGIFLAFLLSLGRVYARADNRRTAGILLLMLSAAFVLAQSEPNLEQSNLWLVLALAQAATLVASRGPAAKG
jgi:O-antigen ligase